MCPLHQLHCLASRAASRACVSPICMAHAAFKAGANALGGSGAGPCRHGALHCLSETRPLDCSQVPAQRNLSVQIHQDTSRIIKIHQASLGKVWFDNPYIYISISYPFSGGSEPFSMYHWHPWSMYQNPNATMSVPDCCSCACI